MAEVKIAHCADLHIGSECKGTGLKSNIRKTELKSTFFRILDECTCQRVDALVIAGDLFDDINIPSCEVEEVKNALDKFKIRTFISPGNHDPFTPDSPYAGCWPDNVIIFKHNYMEYVELQDLHLRIWGAAFNNTYEKNSFLKNIKVLNDDFINVSVIHGEISNSESGFYNSCGIADIEQSGMDYIAFGHIHKRGEVLSAGGTFYSYCGCPEGRGFDEEGEKGFYIGRISKGFGKFVFKRVCKRIYYTLEIDVSDLESPLELPDFIIKHLYNKYGRSYNENLYKIILNGNVEEYFIIDAEAIEVRLSDVLFFSKITDKTEIKIDTEKLAFRSDFKSSFIKKMIKRIENAQSAEEQEIEKQALKCGLAAFSGEVKYNGD